MLHCVQHDNTVGTGSPSLSFPSMMINNHKFNTHLLLESKQRMTVSGFWRLLELTAVVVLAGIASEIDRLFSKMNSLAKTVFF